MLKKFSPDYRLVHIIQKNCSYCTLTNKKVIFRSKSFSAFADATEQIFRAWKWVYFFHHEKLLTEALLRTPQYQLQLNSTTLLPAKSGLLPPPKKEVMFCCSHLSVCLSVGLIANFWTDFDEIFGGVGHDSRTKWYNFVGDPDHTSDPGVQSPKSGSSGLAEGCSLWAYQVETWAQCQLGIGNNATDWKGVPMCQCRR